MDPRYYSKAHVARFVDRLDPPEAIAERIRHAAICKRANAEMLEKFAPLSGENAAAAVAWQEARIKELTEARS